MLAHAPIDIDFAACHGSAVVVHFFHQHVRRDCRWNRSELLTNALPFSHWNRSVARICPLFTEEGTPIHCVLALEVADGDVFRVLAGIHCGAVSLGQVIAECLAHALCGELVSVELARTRVLRNFLVHQWLCERRGVLFVMAEFAETNDVQHHIFIELLAVFERPLCAEHHGLGIIAVHMQYGRFNHLHHI